MGLNHYLPVTVPCARVFQYPNLHPGKYTVSFHNAANPTGVDFSSVRLTIDAIRVHKGESLSASPLYWGADGRGASGTWDNGVAANWRGAADSTCWEDFGADDHHAVFAGPGGTIEVAAPVRVSRLEFRSDGYLLRGDTLS